MKLNNEKCRILHLRKNDPIYPYMLRNTQLKSSFAEKSMGILVEPERCPCSKRQKMESHAVVMYFQ